MSRWRVKLASTLLKSCTAWKAKQFSRALQNPAAAQQQVFDRIVTNLSQSAYGKTLKIAKSITYQTFRDCVPLVTYDQLTPWIERQKLGTGSIFTPEPVIFFAKTSGSSGAAKYIPYTKSLLRAFNDMFSIWAHDVLSHGPPLQSGKIFMSISPANRQEKLTAGNIPIGLNHDSEYLRRLTRWLTQPFLVTPPASEFHSMAAYRYLLAATLISTANLEILSIWNPTYLLTLLETVVAQRDSLMRDLSQGFISHDAARIHFPKISASRLALLAHTSIPWQALWPQLKLISCWTAGSASIGAKKLSTLFPTVLLQGKGLLATEAPITLPLLHAPGCVPLLTAVFFEFITADNQVLLLHELREGETYEMIISQWGGLYRYRLGDRVQVVGRHHNTPCLEFIGRNIDTCDLVGEKLTEKFVCDILSMQAKDQACFNLLVPTLDSNGFGQYVLLSESDCAWDSEQIDNGLSKSYHYQNARILGQLQQAKIRVIAGLPGKVQDFFVAKGMRWGDIKERIFLPDVGLAKELLSYIKQKEQ